MAPPNDLTVPPSDRTSKFLHCVQQTSPHLCFQSLRAEQLKDPHLLSYIQNCEKTEDKSYKHDDKLRYFLGGTHNVLCREVADPLFDNTKLQVCLPTHLAYDFCLVAHRSTRGPALQVGGLAPHYSTGKMAKLLSKRFYIRKLTSILQTISNSCEICHETKPKKRNRSDYVKQVLKVLRPGQGWYCDYLRVSTVPSVWGFNELMVFCDCYTIFAW